MAGGLHQQFAGQAHSGGLLLHHLHQFIYTWEIAEWGHE
jgi:hypothetical protein